MKLNEEPSRHQVGTKSGLNWSNKILSPPLNKKVLKDLIKYIKSGGMLKEYLKRGEF